MAQTAATMTSDFAGFLSPEISQSYFEKAQRQSVAQTLIRQIPLGINGQEIPYVTSRPTASWVSEGGKKPTTSNSLGIKTIKPHKLACISVSSAEVVRANPGNFMSILQDDIAEAFAIAFDEAVFHGTSSPFGVDQYIGSTTKAVAIGTATADAGGTYADLNGALKLLVDDKKKLTGWAFDDNAEPLLNSAVDLNGRPLFVDAVYENSSLSAGKLLRRPAFYNDGVGIDTTVGFAGDWTQAAWGVVGGISYDVSTETAVTINGELTSLWENNLVAIRAEAEYGFILNDADSFVKLNEAAGE